MSYLLDTNIISAILKNNQTVNRKYRAVRGQKKTIFISGITYYEVKRGLLYVNATRKLSDFDKLCQRVPVVLPDMEILEIASGIHVDLKARGLPIGDADILIAATAMARDLVLVSNDSDLLRVAGLTVENWLSTASS